MVMGEARRCGRALDAKPLAELELKYGSNKEAVYFKYSKRTKPAVVIKAKTPPQTAN
jgi:hypothetical protein